VIHLSPEKKTSPSASSGTGPARTVAPSDGRLQLVPDTGLKLFIPSLFSVGAGILCPSFYEPSSDGFGFQAFFHVHEIFLPLISLLVPVLPLQFS
jgi:hypothetical protein